MGKNRRRIYALISVVAMVGATLAVAPALGDEPLPPSPDVLRLQLGANGQHFAYGDYRHPLTATRCEVNDPPAPADLAVLEQNLMDMSATSSGRTRPVGLDSLGIGVKTGGAQGVPCGRIDTNEILTLSVPEHGPLAGRAFDGLQFDLELKGSAWVVVDLYLGDALDPEGTFQLATGASIEASGIEDNHGSPITGGGYTTESNAEKPGATCAGTADSGPDSGPNDNCVWTIDPGMTFDRIVLTAKVGEFSLEGGGDFGSNPEYETMFFLEDTTPRAVNDDPVWMDQGALWILIDVLWNDSPQNPSPTITGVTQDPDTARGVAEVVPGVDDDPDKVLYTPNRNDPDAPEPVFSDDEVFKGYDTFEYTLEGGSTATVFVYERFGCEDPLEVEKLGVTASYERIPSDGCPDKSYELDVITTNEGEGDTARDLPTVLFKPRHGDNPDCSLVPRPEGCTELFKGTLTFAPRLAENGAVNSGELQYDPKDDEVEVFRPVLWCKVNPFAGYDPALLNPYPNLPANPDDVLPAGESWCIAYETTVPMSEVESYVGPQRTQTTWVVYGIGDPLKRVS